MTERHYLQGLRSNKPKFAGAVFSHAGEFGPGMYEGIEMVAMQEKAWAVSHPPRDGSKPSEVAARVRQMLHDAVAIAIAKGYGRLIRTCGHPMTARAPANPAGAG